MPISSSLTLSLTGEIPPLGALIFATLAGIALVIVALAVYTWAKRK